MKVLESPAVVVDWGSHIVGSWSALLSVIVALSMFGSCVSASFAYMRVMMAMAREGKYAGANNSKHEMFTL